MKLIVVSLLFVISFGFCPPWSLNSLLLLFLLALCPFFLNHFLTPGGLAWLNTDRKKPIPGPSGLPFIGSLAEFGSLAHQNLAAKASSLGATRLMALSFGSTRVVVSSHPETAKEILCGSAFVDRPVKPSAKFLLFERAIGFAPCGDHWRRLRKMAAMHLFSPKTMMSLETTWLRIANDMVETIQKEMESNLVVKPRNVLRTSSLRMMTESVFGGCLGSEVEDKLGLMVNEGYELITRFNLEDHFPSVWFLDVHGVKRKCYNLAARVQELLTGIVNDKKGRCSDDGGDSFLAALLSVSQKDPLNDSDIIAVLWEMMFRGTDTVANLLEWTLARISIHQDIQIKLRQEIRKTVGNRHVEITDIMGLPYLKAFVKEVLRLHPPGPLLSWSRLAIKDAYVDKHLVPSGTTALVNMWAIAHDPTLWPDPWRFKPERFMKEEVSIMGSDMRLAPFGSGRRVCPGKDMGLATVHLWLARLIQRLQWVPIEPVNMSEILKLSLEMKKPLKCRIIANA